MTELHERTDLVVEDMWRFPVKSMQGEQLASSPVDERGLRGDRQWAVRDLATGTTLTARRSPELLFAAARFHDATDEVEITTGDGAAIDDLSAFLGRDVELVRAGSGGRPRYEIATDFEQEDTAPWMSWQGPERTFHDSAKTVVSLLSTGSIGRWDRRRFRANLLARGQGETDLVGAAMRIGTVEVRSPKRISRCVMVTRPQPGGIERDLEVLRTINRGTGDLGLSLIVTSPGVITVGDVVEVLAPATT